MSSDPVATTTAAVTGTWLHGVVPEAVAEASGTVTGLTDTPVRAVRGSGLAAVFSAVPLDQYGEQSLRRNLEDLAWLERTARAHHRVVDALARTGPVVPARLATVHTDERRLAALLHERRADLAATLTRLAGHQEWGVKGYVVPGDPGHGDGTAPPAGDGGPDAPTTGATGAGAAYLRRRRAPLRARESGQQVAAHSAAAVYEELAGHAADARRHAPQDGRLSGDPRPMALNAAYLVPVDRLAAFRAAVTALGARHPTVRLELTGPWPAYSFIGQPGS